MIVIAQVAKIYGFSKQTSHLGYTHGLLWNPWHCSINQTRRKQSMAHMHSGVKDWVHMKTTKMMQDFNCFCNLAMNHKLLLIFKIKVVYLCTLHNKIISPSHIIVYMLWRPMPTWFSNKKMEFSLRMNADLFLVVRYSVGTPVGKWDQLVQWS